jgi:8-oxo-dGTP pyrophosphatase MutT (NUDIX family)
MDPLGRIFLQHSRDPGDPSKGSWWELPGGGIDRGETAPDAIRRELYEECGFTGVEVGDLLWHQRVQFRFANIDFDQSEDIHLATVAEAEESKPTHLEALEVLAFLGARWWDLAEFLAADDACVPPDLRDRLRETVVR